jgi:hypothetical protein
LTAPYELDDVDELVELGSGSGGTRVAAGYKLETMATAANRIGEQAARARLLFKRGSTCRTGQEEGWGGIGLHRRVCVGYEQEEEEDGATRARDGSETKREEGVGSPLGPAGPNQ